MDPKQQLGRNIREIRNQAGLSQEDLGLESDVDRTYISGVERGVRNPTVVILDRIARALNVPAGDLMKGIGAKRR